VEWRGRVRVTAEPGDELTQAGLSEVIFELKDTIAAPGRCADVVNADGRDSGVGFVIEPPRLLSAVELQAQVALATYLEMLRRNSQR
jgi:hypothetical protein